MKWVREVVEVGRVVLQKFAEGRRGSVLRCGCIIFDGIQCVFFLFYKIYRMFVWHMCVFGAEWWIGSRGKDSYGEANKHFCVPYVYRIFCVCVVVVVCRFVVSLIANIFMNFS